MEGVKKMRECINIEQDVENTLSIMYTISHTNLTFICKENCINQLAIVTSITVIKLKWLKLKK